MSKVSDCPAIVIITTGHPQGAYLSIAQALERLEDHELMREARSAEAAALHLALRACPIDSLAGLRWATRDLRQWLELENVPEDIVVLGRKIEAYTHGVSLPESPATG